MPTPELPPYDIYEYDVAMYLAQQHKTHYQHELRIKRAGFKAMADELRKRDHDWLQSITDAIHRGRDAA